MSPAVWGLVRAGAAVLAGVGLTYAAVQVPWTTSLSPATSAAAAAATPTVAPVATNVLICPGPESEGLQGVPAVGGTTTVFAASPPAQVMQGIDVSGTSGTLTVTADAGPDRGRGSTEERGRLVQGPLTGASVGQVVGAGALAAGLSGLQTTVATEGDDRAAVATACQAPRAELWLVAGGGGSTRRERVVLTNPGRQHRVGRRHRAGLVRNPAVGQRPERRHPAPRPHEPARRRAGRPRVHPGRPRASPPVASSPASSRTAGSTAPPVAAPTTRPRRPSPRTSRWSPPHTSTVPPDFASPFPEPRRPWSRPAP